MGKKYFIANYLWLPNEVNYGYSLEHLLILYHYVKNNTIYLKTSTFLQLLCVVNLYFQLIKFIVSSIMYLKT